ncbi:MAG: hypothetical protein H6965_10120 [Chromatiaceae bacterium]|nr:hypothetical protein [Chromatiaceae bacterium]
MAERDKKKILVQVWESLINAFNEKVRKACLNRDAYLDIVLESEASLIMDELPDSNSDAAKSYLSSELNKLGTKQVNLNLSVNTIEKLNKACAERNIPRDSFVNRLLFLLLTASKTGYLEKRLIGGQGRELEQAWEDIRLVTDGLPTPLTGSLNHISDILSLGSPFWAIRQCIEHINGALRKDGLKEKELVPTFHRMLVSVQTRKMDESSLALNCYLPDDMVPGTQEKNTENSLLDFLADISIDRNTSGGAP